MAQIRAGKIDCEEPQILEKLVFLRPENKNWPFTTQISLMLISCIC